MSIKSLFIKSLPVLIAAPILGLYLMGTSDFDDLQYIEQLKQEQREHIRSMAATNAAYREFYKIEVEDDVSSQIFAQR